MDFARAREIMVDSQIRPNDVTEPGIVSAFLRTPRELFTPADKQGIAYSEHEITTSPGRALWTPRDTAKLIKLADIKASDTALVAGAGAGYEAALISQLAARVVALEETQALADAMAQRFDAVGARNAEPLAGPLELGAPGAAPFDVIYVAGMLEVLPDAWTDQLRDGGRLVAVIIDEGGVGRGTVVHKSGTALSARAGFDASPPRFSAFDRKPSFSF